MHTHDTDETADTLTHSHKVHRLKLLLSTTGVYCSDSYGITERFYLTESRNE